MLLGAGDGKEGGRKPPGSGACSSILVIWGIQGDDHFRFFDDEEWRWSDVERRFSLA